MKLRRLAYMGSVLDVECDKDKVTFRLVDKAPTGVCLCVVCCVWLFSVLNPSFCVYSLLYSNELVRA